MSIDNLTPKGNPLPPRRRGDNSEENKTKEGIINASSLKSKAVERAEQATPSETPWRDDSGVPDDVLPTLFKKTSIDLPVELELRFAFLLKEKLKAQKKYGKKIKRSDLIIEAFEQYTTTQLKALGYKKFN